MATQFDIYQYIVTGHYFTEQLLRDITPCNYYERTPGNRQCDKWTTYVIFKYKYGVI